VGFGPESAAAEISYSNVQGGCPEDAACDAGVSDQDPLFAEPTEPDGGLALQAGSLCIDSTDGTSAPDVDIVGNGRYDSSELNDDCDHCQQADEDCTVFADIGAYEHCPE
jgi:hypothetical protein